ncbi:glutamine amidotransferase of anthranilate synthase [Methanosalsum zhilinae DSM 4017]|uniref:anthranilate synthase n=1 Tax=Methanosalsum zhilinae (strain DSM 4017 / NBRC 107636 / OCM 62 / WeN5) TaxID=679901 RepID=F7XN96_METZD|nr:aminodeoxychorismate/anthranilate synthase component II [Methanosalsum zhilinae]AEH60054.1 glutamine amidotransferase of anthranilate synthase [Methanosalsum zhilinae DSM 4017]
MKVLFINNRDSFVWNLVDYFSILNAETVVVSNTVSIRDIESMQPDAIVISPGPGSPENPEDTGNCIPIIEHFTARMPILGVCLGHQAINTAFGGRTGHSKAGPVHGKECTINHNGSPLFKDIQDPFISARYHSLAIEILAPDIEVIARSEDGIIMGIAHRKYAVYGVQFHPESILTPDGMTVIRNFLDLVRQSKPLSE